MPESPSVTLYGKPDCHLCDEAEAILRRVTAETGVPYVKVDIQSAPELFERYRYRIPVIEVPGGDSLDWPTTRERVKRAIRSAASAR